MGIKDFPENEICVFFLYVCIALFFSRPVEYREGPNVDHDQSHKHLYRTLIL